ncbi:hypothetical protein T07_10413 [Trichinella nelsoni]|uniref:Uncharacterized protein n=1 Tax=Trichinella nelsoni TaxID=6336 RepID=A0A0V0SDH5_9BILA|nr:hypothetical protein T07_10413 [Trichinella nelsoni]
MNRSCVLPAEVSMRACLAIAFHDLAVHVSIIGKNWSASKVRSGVFAELTLKIQHTQNSVHD